VFDSQLTAAMLSLASNKLYSISEMKYLMVDLTKNEVTETINSRF